MAKRTKLPAVDAARENGTDPSNGLTYRTFGISTKLDTLNEEERSVEVVASTNAIDSYDEIVEQDWDLSRFTQNKEKTGPVLYNHNRATGGFFGGDLRQEETLPIGKAADARVKDGALEAKLIFASAAANPFAERIWNLFREGMLTAVSVGFRTGERRREKRGGRDVTILSKNVLYEISVTPIGANPEAHAKAQKTELEHRALTEDEDHMDPEARIAELTSELGTVKASLEAAKNAASEAENKHKAALAEKDTEIGSLKSALTEKTTEVTKLTGELETSKKSLDEARKEAATLVVKALVGKKIWPSEVDDCVKDYMRDPKDFERRMGLRGELKMTEEVTATTGGTTSTSSAKSADAQLAEIVSGEK